MNTAMNKSANSANGVDSTAALFGGKPEEIAKGLREYSKSAELLSANQLRIVNEHSMKWVGVYQSRIAAKADDLPSLMQELEKRRIPPGETIIRFIERNQRTMIL